MRRFPRNPFGKSPRAEPEAYLKIFEEARSRVFPPIDEYVERMGFDLDRTWLETLALKTQVVIKSSPINWQHGRLLYATLRNYLESVRGEPNLITVFETGTARGFSALCMARALIDGQASGVVISVDIISHNTEIFWNSISDADGKKTRAALIQDWAEELNRVVFLQAWSEDVVDGLGVNRINFAFLDAQHEYRDVLREMAYVMARQESGDVIVFDDVTVGVFDGVVRAVEELRHSGSYEVLDISSEGGRAYAIARRI